MASAFSSSDTAILTAPLDLDPRLQAATASAHAGSLDLRTLYDVERTAETIVRHGFRVVALQFPDEALVDSVPVYWALRDELADRLRGGRVVRKEQDGDGAREGAQQHAGAEASSSKLAAAAGDDAQELPELYILADTSYGNCCVDEVAAAHVDADLVVHYGHTCLSSTANLPALYIFPRLPIDPAHAASSLATYVHDHLGRGSDSDSKQTTTPRTLVLAYDVAYSHAYQDVLSGLRDSHILQADGWEVFPVEIDAEADFKDKVRRAKEKKRAVGACSTACGGGGNRCCGEQESGSGVDCSCGHGPSCHNDASTAASLQGGSIDGDLGGEDHPDAKAHVKDDRIALTSGRYVRLPKGRTLDAASSAVLYLGSESRALTNLLLRLGPTFPVISYDPTRCDSTGAKSASASTSSPPVRQETGKTNRLLMQRYAMVQRARDASVVGLLVGTLGVASYLPLLDRLRSRLTGGDDSKPIQEGAKRRRKKGGRKVYTVSVGKLNPAKLANFQEIEVWVLIACPENSLIGASGAGAGAGGSGTLSGANGHGGDFWRPIVTPFEMELALGPEGVWTGEYEVDLAKVTDRLDRVSVQDKQGEDRAEDQDDGDEDDDDDDVPHYSLVTGSYVSRAKYGGDLSSRSDGDGVEGRNGKPNTKMVALRSQGGKEVAVIESASGLTHVGASSTSAREWGGLTRPEGMERFVPSVLAVGRSGVAGGYAHADGHAEGRGQG